MVEVSRGLWKHRGRAPGGGGGTPTVIVHDGEGAPHPCGTADYDLIVLDRMMSKLSGERGREETSLGKQCDACASADGARGLHREAAGRTTSSRQHSTGIGPENDHDLQLAGNETSMGSPALPLSRPGTPPQGSRQSAPVGVIASSGRNSYAGTVNEHVYLPQAFLLRSGGKQFNLLGASQSSSSSSSAYPYFVSSRLNATPCQLLTGTRAPDDSKAG